MANIEQPRNTWPALAPIKDWEDTCTTVHMWIQVIGKIQLELSPWINHSWGSTLHISSCGIKTSAIPYGGFKFEIEFNFIDHKLKLSTSKGGEKSFELKSMTVAEFYRQTMDILKKSGIEVSIYTRPVEVEVAIPFEEDTSHESYDADAIHSYWQSLLQVDRVFTEFRAGFIGKSSPSHFFWGAFDLAVTRFSGRTAPKHPGGAPNCADWVMEEAYSHELSSAGYWPGTGFGEPAFYSYTYPEPMGFQDSNIEPIEAFYDNDLGEFVLPYSIVQSSKDPDSTLHRFLKTSYEAGADNGGWDRLTLENNFKRPNK